MDDWLPRERYEVLDDDKLPVTLLEVFSDPLYASLRGFHRRYDTLRLTTKFMIGFYDVVEIGVMTDPFSNSYELKPLFHKTIERLYWPTLEENGLTLHMHPEAEQFNSMEAFYASNPAHSDVMTYHADFPVPYRIENYQPANEPTTISHHLQGPHQFVTYIGAERFWVEIDFDDLDIVEGEDDIELVLSNLAGDIIASKTYVDDAYSSGRLRLEAEIFDEAAYTVQIRTTSDIIITRIETSQQYITFRDSIEVFSNDEMIITTNARDAILAATNGAGRQEVFSGDKSFDASRFGIGEKYSMWIVKEENNIGQLDVPNGGVKVSSFDRALYAFSEAAYINPYPASFYSDEIDYVLTSYVSGVTWKNDDRKQYEVTAEAKIDLSHAYMNKDGDYRLILSIPEVVDAEGYFFLESLDITFEKPKLNVLGFIRAVLAYLPGL